MRYIHIYIHMRFHAVSRVVQTKALENTKRDIFGSMGATQAAEWEMLCESQACEEEDEEIETANKDIQHVMHQILTSHQDRVMDKKQA